ncbi:NAD(P)-binding protein [Rhizopogon vinicolor AM-OR11-026]|uniref:NAD(P)-binding protein n=1 Tax=Rhizopogon vinicolor AM-OR11-026 TaxID=1314800 RepID=A0A1B7MY96_9AGAM|nr:NAD(P)-binding protein [Rhizopogon vinicolor AM-OR11-026]
MAQSTPRVWLITGSSSGFGRAMVEEVLRNGEIAVATLRKPSVLDDLADQYPRTHLLVVPLDVTNEAQVKSAFVKAKDVFGRVDVVYNNAGQVLLQEAEGTSMDRARALMDINYWGAVTVSLEAVRFFREENPKGAGGLLMQVSSLCAMKGVPKIAFYSSTKAALDLFTEVLAQEVLPAWNIKVHDPNSDR